MPRWRKTPARSLPALSMRAPSPSLRTTCPAVWRCRFTIVILPSLGLDSHRRRTAIRRPRLAVPERPFSRSIVSGRSRHRNAPNGGSARASPSIGRACGQLPGRSRGQGLTGMLGSPVGLGVGFSGWPAEAVEFFRGLQATTPRPTGARTRDMTKTRCANRWPSLLSELSGEFGPGADRPALPRRAIPGRQVTVQDRDLRDLGPRRVCEFQRRRANGGRGSYRIIHRPAGAVPPRGRRRNRRRPAG